MGAGVGAWVTTGVVFWAGGSGTEMVSVFFRTSKSFHKKSDAVAWAKVQEAMMQTGEWKSKDKRYSTIGDLIRTYLIKATPKK